MSSIVSAWLGVAPAQGRPRAESTWDRRAPGNRLELVRPLAEPVGHVWGSVSPRRAGAEKPLALLLLDNVRSRLKYGILELGYHPGLPSTSISRLPQAFVLVYTATTTLIDHRLSGLEG